jgi:hypothetical protein
MRVLTEKIVLVLLVCDGGRVDVTVVNHHLLIVYLQLGYTLDKFFMQVTNKTGAERNFAMTCFDSRYEITGPCMGVPHSTQRLETSLFRLRLESRAAELHKFALESLPPY